ncbi:hypothetical protein [Kocuria turfanensis]|uniref:Uncharacterized protein n=1 Tax=Kocuria turfanensis TaxID=388357 RepID=A0A512IIJ0_9MICC|nr:hypothetical protein [Kocuria turfanensis]GEO97510.1 hypothetical protein KTU01_36330 [Kocuria turfanensis]
MSVNQLPHDQSAVLTTANVLDGQVLTGSEMDLGGLSRVVTTVIDDDAVLYGEFTVEEELLQVHDPGQVQHHPAALCGIVEDWDGPHDGAVTLSAYVYVHTHEHGALGLSLPAALRVLNDIRRQCVIYLRKGTAQQ